MMIRKIKKLYDKYGEIVNYLIFGVLTTIISLAIYYILVGTVLDPKVSYQLQIANVLSWIGGVLFAYFTNRKYVFKSRNKNIMLEFMKFTGSRVSTLILDMVIMFLFVTVLKYNDKVFKIISQVLVIIGNYILSKVIVFKKKNNVR